MTLLSCWILIALLNFDTFLSHNSTGRKYVDGSEFHVELWPQVKIPHWIMIPGQNSTLNCDPNRRSQFNVELWFGVTIQRGIQTWGHYSMWNQDPGSQFNEGPNFIRRRDRNTMTPCLGVAIQHEKSVESWAQPVESRPHGSKFNGVKIQSYTGINCIILWSQI